MQQIMIKITIALLAFFIGVSAAGIFGNMRPSTYQRPAGCRYKSRVEMTLPPMPSPPAAPLAPAPPLMPSDARLVYAVDITEMGKDGKTYRRVQGVSGAVAPSR